MDNQYSDDETDNCWYFIKHEYTSFLYELMLKCK